MSASDLEVVELTEDTWPDLVGLFGPNGAVAGCWCTWFLQSAKQMQDNGTDVNREMLHDRVRAGVPVGLLARAGTEPVGWVAVAPRPVYPRLARSPLTRPVDPTEDLADVWSVTCLFVHRTARRRVSRACCCPRPSSSRRAVVPARSRVTRWTPRAL